MQPAQRGRKASILIGPALWDAFFGDAASARKEASAAAALSNERDVDYGVGFAFALAGERLRAEGLAKDLEARFPEDTAVQSIYVPVIRALLAMAGGENAGAIEALKLAGPYE